MKTKMTKLGVLLINLGTPDDCSPSAVRRYLTQFLNDPRVIDLPTPIRLALVNLLIVPFRHKKTAHAYQQIWGEAGSPLLTFTEKLKAGLSEQLGEGYQVEIGMRYGNPSIAHALTKLQGLTSITVLPLFPQYSSAATGSALEEVNKQLMKSWNMPSINIKHDFYADPGFIKAYAAVIRDHLPKVNDLLVFSYHGLPERHIEKSACRASCDKQAACPPINQQNHFCYRAQCYATTLAIAKELQLSPNQYTVSFQSRLGRHPWIKPYTDLLLPSLAAQGLKHIAMVSPSFVADCLETLEEINIRTRAQWQQLGGKSFTFIPCLNDSPLWVQAIKNWINP